MPVPINSLSYLFTHLIFLWMADFNPQNVIEQPVDGFVSVEHQEELSDQWEVTSPKQLPCYTQNIVSIEFMQKFGVSGKISVCWVKQCFWMNAESN